MIYKYCDECSAEFSVADHEDWKTLCWACWKRNNQRSPSVVDRKIEILEAQVGDLRRRLRAAELPIEDLLRLRRLCHPDKHSGSEAAYKASILLNRLISERK